MNLSAMEVLNAIKIYDRFVHLVRENQTLFWGPSASNAGNMPTHDQVVNAGRHKKSGAYTPVEIVDALELFQAIRNAAVVMSGPAGASWGGTPEPHVEEWAKAKPA